MRSLWIQLYHARIRASFLTEFYRRGYRRLEGPFYFDTETITFNRSTIDLHSLSQLMLAIPFVQWNGAGDRFLDVGPGAGASFNTILNLLPGTEIFAVEPDSTVIPSLKRNYPSLHTVPDLATLIERPDPTKFKLVLMSHSLEHFNSSEIIQALEQLRGLLHESGVLVIEVPNNDFRTRHVDMRYNDAPHLCFFSREALRTALERAGFRVLFMNSSWHTYDDMWPRVQARNLPEQFDRNSFLRALKQETSDRGQASSPQQRNVLSLASWAKPIARRLLPLTIRDQITKLRSTPADKRDAAEILYDWLSSSFFQYGGDRLVLRVVADQGPSPNSREVDGGSS